MRDYSNAVKVGASFSVQTDQQLLDAARLESSPSHHTLIGLLIDDMYIKEDLVYNKHDGKLVGFVNLGKINKHMIWFEEQLLNDDDYTYTAPALAKSMLSIIVKGLFTGLRFSYAQFSCCKIAGEQLFFPFWESVFA